MNKLAKRFRNIDWFFWGIIAIQVVLYVALGYCLYKIIGYVDKYGLKSLLEPIWCGAKGCK